MDPAINRELVVGLRRGDPHAFDQVYAAFRVRLFSFLVRLSQRRDLAEDLVQETWLRLTRHAQRLRDDTVLSAWLFTVARNLYASHRRWTLVDLTRTDAVRDTPPGAPPSPFELTAASETQVRLELALASLPVADREVLLLIAGEGMTHDEAAAVLGLKPDALRKRLSRARARLGDRLDSPKPALSEPSEVPA
jgi:RNA polymerase sigma-70 factor (ECF subfamily)